MTRGRRVGLVVGALVAWGACAVWVVPALIRSAYRGESLPFLNAMLQGRTSNPLDAYLDLWRSYAIKASVAALLAGLVFVLVSRFRRTLPARRAAEREHPHVYSFGDLLYLSAWSAIVLGLIEAAYGFIRHRIDHLPTGEVVSGELFWMTVAAAMAGLFLLAFLLLGVHHLTGRRFSLQSSVTTVAFGVPVSSILLAMRAGLAWYAITVLSLGVGIAVARGVSGYPRAVSRTARRHVSVLSVALVAWAVALPLWRSARDARTVDRLPAAAPGSPNVLVVIWDAVRALNLSVYGYERNTTPRLDQMAEKALVFERAIATAPWSLPSHGSIFTGRYPHELSVGRRIPLDDAHPTIGEVLQKRGYVTGGFTANLFYGSDDYGIGRGFTWYDARPPLRWQSVIHTWHISETTAFWIASAFGNHETLLRRPAAHVNSAFLRWQERHANRPFLAVLNSFDAHEPYYPHPPFNTAFSSTPPRYWFDDFQTRYPQDVLDQLRTAYDGGIRYLDAELGRMLDELRARGVLDNTLVIVTSDHGEEFGEHGDDVFGHARSLYYPVLHVPMVVYFPPRIAGTKRFTTPVSIRDIPATILDVVDPRSASPLPGVSLLGYADGRDSLPEFTAPRLAMAERHNLAKPESKWPAAKTDMYSVLVDSMHLIWTGDREEVFNVARDPWEKNDLSGTPFGKAELARMRAVLDAQLAGKDGKWRARR